MHDMTISTSVAATSTEYTCTGLPISIRMVRETRNLMILYAIQLLLNLGFHLDLCFEEQQQLSANKLQLAHDIYS